MKQKNGRVGIDVGALCVKGVRIDSHGNPVAEFYEPHRGDSGKTIEACLQKLQVGREDSIGITGGGAELFAETLGVPKLDITRCQIEAVRSCLPGICYIIDIGGGSATLIQFDQQGRFQGYSTNSLCAAGTGSFLDEQAFRLGISHKDTEAFAYVDHPPTIATRCSVFAKSDLIHRQQEGFSKAAMWSGLCRGMTRTLLGTLLNGRPLDGPAAIIGGVAQNREVLRWLEHSHPGLIRVPAKPHLMAALGAATQLSSATRTRVRPVGLSDRRPDKQDRHPWVLSMEKSVFPSMEVAEGFTDLDGNEIRLIDVPKNGGTLRGFLGIDVGSTSTKLALVDDHDRVVLDIYRKTGGDPIGATRYLFRALSNVSRDRGFTLEIQGVGSTGSGRKLVGKVIGADAIINEISAHVAGAVRTDPTIDTIFEIGGQDSKYMHVVDGHIRDANMNYVCAAGTGSFVEEQANKLGYPVSRVGGAVLGLRPVRTADRCTVFMEQDVGRFIRAGASPEEALAGVMVSVVKNYLNKVVGNRHRSRAKIFFQGATARNPALVAAFERVLGVQMVVSPYCHVMGAFGVALLTRQIMAEQGAKATSFRGLDLADRKISLRTETCNLCQNHCPVTLADIDGVNESPSWGYMCGRDPDEQRVRSNPREQPLRLRQKLWRECGSGVPVPDNAPVVGIPQALTTYSYLPLWQRFFNRLGFRVQLSGPTTQAIRENGTRLAGAEFCFPVKVALGHVASLATREGVDFIVVPHMVSESPSAHCIGSKFCPYVQSVPSFAKTALALNGLDAQRFLTPVVDMRLSEKWLVSQLAKALSSPLGRSLKEIRRAWRDGLSAQRNFESRCQEEGDRFLEEAAKRGEKLLLLVGRPYNNFDQGLNLGLPQKIAEQGRTVLPIDMLRADIRTLGQSYRNLYWTYGQKVLASIQRVADSDKLDAIYLTNFNCGPDSFILSFAENELGNRPFLALELDEHGADAGYMTRIEAYFDVLRRPRPLTIRPAPSAPEPRNLKDRVIWIPPMHPLGTPFFAAAFRGAGFDARPLPPEDQEAFELGRAVTRGGECLPTALTIGALLKALAHENGNKKHAFFMPTAEGPCRFGQYCTLHRQVLDREGLSDVAILSPSSFNSYQGVKEAVRRKMWQALLAADVILKAVLKVRPYETRPGETNRVLAEQQLLVETALARGGDVHAAVRGAVERLAAVPRSGSPKPLVGVVGEIYVRCNSFANEDVIGAIELLGGEAWLVPMGEWILYTAATQTISFWDRSNNVIKKWMADLRNLYLFSQEHRMLEAAGPFLANRREPPIRQVIEEGMQHLPLNFEGESILTVGRTMLFAKQGAAMVVNCAPFGCMPGTITTALFRKLAPELGIPVVNMFYDGHGNENKRLEVFLNNVVTRKRPPAAPRSPAKEERPEESPPAMA